MNIKFKQSFVGLIMFALLTLSTNLLASPFSFNTGSDLGTCTGLSNANQLQSCTTDDMFTISTSAPDSYLNTETFRGVTALGIAGGTNDLVPGEIDEGESLELTLPTPTVLESIDFSRLFTPGSGDAEFEEVHVTTNLPNVTGTLTLNSGTTAIWSWTDGVNNFSQIIAATDPSIIAPNQFGAGWYSVTNPFGTTPITSLTLTPPASATGDVFDFALVSASRAPTLQSLFDGETINVDDALLFDSWTLESNTSNTLIDFNEIFVTSEEGFLGLIFSSDELVVNGNDAIIDFTFSYRVTALPSFPESTISNVALNMTSFGAEERCSGVNHPRPELCGRDTTVRIDEIVVSPVTGNQEAFLGNFVDASSFNVGLAFSFMQLEQGAEELFIETRINLTAISPQSTPPSSASLEEFRQSFTVNEPGTFTLLILGFAAFAYSRYQNLR